MHITENYVGVKREELEGEKEKIDYILSHSVESASLTLNITGGGRVN